MHIRKFVIPFWNNELLVALKPTVLRLRHLNS
jgi:hypothetical protein